MRDEGLYLDDIVGAAEDIKRFVNNISKADFFSNDLIQSAVLQKLSIIGEASSRISDELKLRYTEINWKAIKGLRNIAIHSYFTVDWDIIWEIIQSNIPDLMTQVEKIINDDFPLPPESAE